MTATGDAETVDMWFDPTCPWAWVTSRWLLEVEKVRNVEVRFHVMSLSVLNEGRDISPEYAERMEQAWAPARVSLAVEEQAGPIKLAEFYTAIGTRLHNQQQPRTRETIAAALADADLPAGLADAGDTDENDEALRASHHEGMDPVGDEVGTPVIRIHGKSLFGPVITPAPKGEAAGELFDGVSKVTAYDGFFELKRTRTRSVSFE